MFKTWYNHFAPCDSSLFNHPSKKVEKTDDTVTLDGFLKIVMILDESGSMSSIRNDMIKSINDLITEQKQIKERPATFTLVKFNDKTTRVVVNKPLENVKLLTTEDYNPNGSTALYDCIGDTVKWFRNEKDVLLIIVTDGQENASTKYRKSEVLRMIEEKKESNGWTYVYLSDDLSTAKQADDIGIYESTYATNCVIEKQNFGSYISKNLNSAVKSHRRTGVTVQSSLNKH
uniref:VWFA domain-containing protein n=1 Tax=viral metagenome TaxID=1070528 RepID=A0A6C0EA08_9ZZZZ